MFDRSCDIYVHGVMHLCPFILLLMIYCITSHQYNMVAYMSIPTCTYFVFVKSLISTDVRFCSAPYGLTSFDVVKEDP